MNRELLKQQDEFVYSEIFDWNVYQITLEEARNANILDIGGHYGMFDIYCHELGAKQIVSIEANPKNFITLLKNTKHIQNIKALNAAVTNNTGDSVTINDIGCRSQIGKEGAAVTTISFTDTLDFFPSNEDILLKMDIEGAEYPLFLNTPAHLFKRFKYIYIELHDENVAGPGNKIDTLNQYIQNLGFKSVWRGYFHVDGTTNNDISVFKYARV